MWCEVLASPLKLKPVNSILVNKWVNIQLLNDQRWREQVVVVMLSDQERWRVSGSVQTVGVWKWQLDLLRVSLQWSCRAEMHDKNKTNVTKNNRHLDQMTKTKSGAKINTAQLLSFSPLFHILFLILEPLYCLLNVPVHLDPVYCIFLCPLVFCGAIFSECWYLEVSILPPCWEPDMWEMRQMREQGEALSCLQW